MVQSVDKVANKRLIKPLKLFFRDTAVVAYLLQIHDKATIKKGTVNSFAQISSDILAEV